MARVRSVSPDIWLDKKVQRLSWACVPFYVGTISVADDFGRFEWEATELAGRIVGLRPDATLADVVAWMSEIEKELVVRYEVGGNQYAFHPNWRNHQYVSRPSKRCLPAPPLHLQGQSSETALQSEGNAVQEQGGRTESPGPLDTDLGLGLKLNMDSELEILRTQFREAEEDVQRFLAMVAAKNRTGKITMGREITIRSELLEVLRSGLGDVLPAFSYGIEAAVKKEADNANYVKVAALTWLRRPANANKIVAFRQQGGSISAHNTRLLDDIRDEKARGIA